MSIAVVFYSDFTKRVNSTLKPTASNTQISINCLLKDSCSIIEPILEIRGSGSSFNPKYYNYCYIATFDRYYYVNEWRYENAVWNAYCKVDVLASFKIPIGNTTKYILRSSYASNINVVDTFYPALAWKPNFYYDTDSFDFRDNLWNDGCYIIGVSNQSNNAFGAITYYALEPLKMREFIRYLNQNTGDVDWTQPITGMTDPLYRAIYSPIDYIKLCKWFPIPQSRLGIETAEYISFGNYISNVSGNPILHSTSWYTETIYLDLPTGWTSFEGKYKTSPYAQVYLVCNPWGVIELNPLDFTDTNHLKLTIYPDMISGDCILKIFKVVGTTDYFITQSSANISTDIALTSTMINAQGLYSSTWKWASSTAGIASPNPIGNYVAARGAAAEISAALVPTLSGAVGQISGSARAIDGEATLIYTSTYFANEDNADFGKPLCDNRQISTIPGYIQCMDDHIAINGAMLQEIEEVGTYLTGGFYYE